jgi:hypothetical protein
MSEIARSLKILASKYLDGRISLDEFRGDFASLYFQARECGEDKKANSLASKIMGPLAEFARQHRSERSLRIEIEAAIHPLADSLPRARFLALNFVHSYDAGSKSLDFVLWRQWHQNANENVSSPATLTVGASNSSVIPPQREPMSSYGSLPMREIRAVA